MEFSGRGSYNADEEESDTQSEIVENMLQSEVDIDIFDDELNFDFDLNHLMIDSRGGDDASISNSNMDFEDSGYFPTIFDDRQGEGQGDYIEGGINIIERGNGGIGKENDCTTANPLLEDATIQITRDIFEPHAFSTVSESLSHVRPDANMVILGELLPSYERGRETAIKAGDKVLRHSSKPTKDRWRDALSMFGVYTRPEACQILANYIYKRISHYAMEEYTKYQNMRERIAEADKAKAHRKLEEKKATELEELRIKTEKEKRERERQEAEVTERAVAPTSNNGPLPVSAEQTSIQDDEEPSTAIIVTIRGREINIAGLGIDAPFLEALPEEMREEVLTQHLRGLQESASRGDQIDEELVSTFLNVLPDNVRQELIQNDSEEVSATRGDRLHDLDTAFFFATLDPSLRETLLLEQDDESLSTLPPELIAEAQNIRSRTYSRPFVDTPMEVFERQIGSFGTFTDLTRHKKAPPKKKTVSAGTLRLFDRKGIEGLLRTLYLPQPANQRDNLHELLFSVCANRATRSVVLTTLLRVLEHSSLDKNILNMGFKQTSNCAQNDVSKSHVLDSQASADITSDRNVLSHEITPSIVTEQILEALDFLIHSKGKVTYYFVTEHNLARDSNGKDKGNKLSEELKYPINILLNLLDRQTIRGNRYNLDIIMSTIQEIARALTILLKPVKKADVTAKSKPSNAASSSRNDTPQSDNGDDTMMLVLQKPPFIPEKNLTLMSDLLTTKEFTSYTFKSLVSIMQDLSVIDDVKEIFATRLISQAQVIGPHILKDLNELLSSMKSTEAGAEIPASLFVKFSIHNAHPIKLLRALTALDHLFCPSEAPLKQSEIDEGKRQLKGIYEKLSFGPLWTALSDCLLFMQDRLDLIHIATSLLGLIESLMLVCKHNLSEEAHLMEISSSEMSDISISSLESMFFSFTNEHRKILNHLVRSVPDLLNGPFAILLKNPKSLEFDNKRLYFNREIYHNASTTNIMLTVRRDHVFLDSFKALSFRSADEIKYGRLNIKFQEEEGVDAGGVTREWYQVLSRQIFNPDYALFSPVASDCTTFHPNGTSWANPEHLQFFKFIGRIIGKAIYDNKLLDCHFSRTVYKQILGKPVTVKDMETLDLDYYKSLVWMLENDITDIITEMFSVETNDYGERKVTDLKPDGQNIPVTEENKVEYVKLIVEYRLVQSIEEQLSHFLAGFHEIIPKTMVSIFDEQELELLISGMPEIGLDDWINNTEYRNYTASSPQIKWFWRAVRSFDTEEKAKLLQFATGTSKVPLNGFKELVGMHGVSKFTIHRDYGSKDRLPSSHTCFNQIDLPEYQSYESLRSSLLLAVTEGREGFGLA